MGNSVTAFTYDRKTGAMNEVQTIGTLPESFTGQNTCAEIVVHPSGKFLYASNRGDDSVITFAIDTQKGTLTNIGRTSTGGKVPRFFGIDPPGTFMIMCNQNSNSIQTATIDPATGRLTAKDLIETPSPTCAVFLPAADQ
jgi:6-phosphogluconolactonase